MENRYVSTMQVAQALGVSVTTVKRWVDEGVLPAHKTAGGHRKLVLEDVLRLVRERNLPQADLSRLALPVDVDLSDLDEVRDRLVRAMERADDPQVRTLLHGVYQHGHALDQIADRVVSPAMVEVGHEWETGRMAVAGEHRATQAVISALYELKARLRVPRNGRTRPVAVGGAPEHDFTVLGTLLAKMVLLECGWDAVNLGPHTPLNALQTALGELRPRLVWLSISHLVEPDRFLREYREFYRLAEGMGVAVAVGGRALNQEIRRVMPYTTFGDGMSQLAAFARTLVGKHARD